MTRPLASAPARLARALFRLACAGCLAALVASCQPAVGSLGAVLGRDRETAVVVLREVVEGGAADRAGLAPGDELVRIDGERARSLSAEQLRQKLRGEVGSTMDLTVARGDVVLRVRVVRRRLGAGRPVRGREERLESP